MPYDAFAFVVFCLVVYQPSKKKGSTEVHHGGAAGFGGRQPG